MYTNIMDVELWGNGSKICPEPDDRDELKRKWSCKEYQDFNKYEILYQASHVICKGYQIILCVVVFGIIAHRKYKGSKSSYFPILVNTCILLDAIFTFLKSEYLFPYDSNKYSDANLAVIFAALGMFFCLTATWIFVLKYHETAK